MSVNLQLLRHILTIRCRYHKNKRLIFTIASQHSLLDVPLPALPHSLDSRLSVRKLHVDHDHDDVIRKYMKRKFSHPDEERANHLRQLFPRPQELVKAIFTALAEDVNDYVQLSVSPHFSNHMWKALVTSKWPQQFKVEAVHLDREQSIECAYLLMCEQLKHLGLLIHNKESPSAQVWTSENVRRLITAINTLPTFKSNVTMETFRKDNEHKTWETKLSMEWPVPLYLRTEGNSSILSEALAYLRADRILQRKGLEFMDTELKIKQHYKKTQLMYEYQSNCPENFATGNFLPDFEVFTDASLQGFGAYLINQDHEKVRWISEQWDGSFRTHTVEENRIDVCEFYAMVSSIYTWKEKFAGKKGILWNDNYKALKYLNLASKNPGAFYIPVRKTSRMTKVRYYKLFQILIHTLSRWNITIETRYIPSAFNKADLLSKNKLKEFKEEFPNAFPVSKKIKKLQFWIPLQGIPCTCDMGKMAAVDPFNVKKQKKNLDLSFTEDPELIQVLNSDKYFIKIDTSEGKYA